MPQLPRPQRLRGIDVRNYGSFSASASTADRSAALLAAVTAARSATRYPSVYIPAGNWTVSGLAHGSVRFVGDGAGMTRLVHADGVSEPLIHFTDTASGSPPPAVPWYGVVGMTLVAGTSTTALIYYTGNIDNNTHVDDVQFQGNTSNASVDGLSCKDYLNLHMRKVRWDSIGGWGINVRDASVFSHAVLHVQDWTYDNQMGTAGNSDNGKGVLYVDCSGLGVEKGTVHFQDGRIELNDGLSGSWPSRSVFRFVQNATRLSTSAPQIKLMLDNVTGDAVERARHARWVSCDTGDIALHAHNCDLYGLDSIYNNDTHNAKNGIAGHTTAPYRLNLIVPDDTAYDQPESPQVTRFFGMGLSHHSSASTRADGFYTRGAMSYLRTPSNSDGLGYFAAKAVDTTLGRYGGTGASLGTGDISSGTASLAMSTIATAMVPGQLIVIAGAGVASANLTALVTDIDYDTETVTINTNASTTVTGAAVTTAVATFNYVPLVLYGSATLDFGSISAQTCAELTITVTGANTGDNVALGPPSSIEAGLSWSGYVSAANTVTVRLCNVTGSPIDPASASWRCVVTRK